jgi:integrase
LAKQDKSGWLAKRGDSPFYWFGIKIKGRRYFRSTGKTTEREAERERERCREEIQTSIAEAEAAAIRTSERPLETFGEAVNFYWTNIGQYHDGGTPEKMSVGSQNTFWSLSWLKEQIGPGMKLELINGGVAQQVKAKRRGMAKKNAKGGELVANSTVNRSAIQPLRKVLLHAQQFGNAKIAKISWRELLMPEPEERVRELEADEEIRLFEHLRADYQPLIDVAIILGLRQAEAVVKLRWHHVGWGSNTITIPGKGNKTDVMQLPTAARDILWQLRAEVKPESDDELVFSYVAERTNHPSLDAKRTMKQARVAGARYPITKSGLRRAFTNAVAAAGIVNFRYHDLRHTFATRMLRHGGNLKQVQKQLRHRQIDTTMKYAHVLDHEMREVMEAAAAASPRRAAAGRKADVKSEAS